MVLSSKGVRNGASQRSEFRTGLRGDFKTTGEAPYAALGDV